ncbi:hypothetical protein AB1L30_00690, partial [Bremerella sp. JC817]|uniref:hypothetical protein n=1 Tax=Bremerella sp. JC817 TaxID=3231756 RepID=UPI003458433F
NRGVTSRKDVNNQVKFGFNKLLRDSAVALNGHVPFRRHAQQGSSESSEAFYAGRTSFVNLSEEGGFPRRI